MTTRPSWTQRQAQPQAWGDAIVTIRTLPPQLQRYLYISIGRGGNTDDHRTERLQLQGGHGHLAHRAVALAGGASLYIPALCGERYSKCKGTCGGIDDDREEAVQQ